MSAAAPVARKGSIDEIAENIGPSILTMLVGLGNDLSREPNNQCSVFIATDGGENVDPAFLDGVLNCDLCLAGLSYHIKSSSIWIAPPSGSEIPPALSNDNIESVRPHRFMLVM